MLTKDEAVCIRAVDYSETSQIVTFFTRATGKISAIAKGSKRPKSAFDGPIEVFSFGKIVFSYRSDEKLVTLTEFEQEPGLTNLANNFFALNCASFAAELLGKLTNEHDPHPELFDSFLQFLKSTAETSYGSRETISLLIVFQLALLREIGLQPVLKTCANCKTSNEMGDTRCEVYFSSSANGLICRDCEGSFPDRVKLSGAAVRCLGSLGLIREAQEKTLEEIEKILVYHFTEILGQPLRTAKYVMICGR